MRTALLRRIVVAFVGVLGILAAGWITASRTTSESNFTADAVVSADAQAECDMSACAHSCPAETAPAAATPVVAAEAAPAASQEPGMVAYLDPETGEIGGMPPGGVDEGQITQDGPSRVPVDAIAVDGSPMQVTNGAFDEYSVIRIDAQGKARLVCGPDAKALLAAPVPVPMPEEK